MSDGEAEGNWRRGEEAQAGRSWPALASLAWGGGQARVLLSKGGCGFEENGGSGSQGKEREERGGRRETAHRGTRPLAAEGGKREGESVALGFGGEAGPKGAKRDWARGGLAEREAAGLGLREAWAGCSSFYFLAEKTNKERAKK